MAAIEARASPRKPLVRIEKSSSADFIFEVACLAKERRASEGVIPRPLSTIRIKVLPDSLMYNSMLVLSASTAFSKSSLTAEAGR